ncbi:hypothetical protein JC605_01780 [Flavobacterium sp. IB48]|nr:hypothetical protein [Flavobacterium sp. IB48]
MLNFFWKHRSEIHNRFRTAYTETPIFSWSHLIPVFIAWLWYFDFVYYFHFSSTIGKLIFSLVLFPFCSPGIHLGDRFKTRVISDSNLGLISFGN